MRPVHSLSALSDDELVSRLRRLIGAERAATVDVIVCLAEFDTRRLYLPLGFSSLFTYCRDHLHLGEGAAYRRIEAARASRRFPEILTLLNRGRITLTNLGLVAPHLTAANHATLLDEISHKRKSEVEIIIARLKPQPDAPSFIRRVPAHAGRHHAAGLSDDAVPVAVPAPLPAAVSPARPVIAPLSPERFKLQITMSQDTHDTLRELQDLLRHAVPSGDPAVIIERALKCLRQEVLRRKCGLRKSDIKEDDPRRPEPGGHASLLH